MILDPNELLTSYQSAVVARDLEAIDRCSRNLGVLLSSSDAPEIGGDLKHALERVHVEAFDFVKSERDRVEGAMNALQKNQNRDKAYLETSKAV